MTSVLFAPELFYQAPDDGDTSYHPAFLIFKDWILVPNSRLRRSNAPINVEVKNKMTKAKLGRFN